MRAIIPTVRLTTPATSRTVLAGSGFLTFRHSTWAKATSTGVPHLEGLVEKVIARSEGLQA